MAQSSQDEAAQAKINASYAANPNNALAITQAPAPTATDPWTGLPFGGVQAGGLTGSATGPSPTVFSNGSETSSSTFSSSQPGDAPTNPYYSRVGATPQQTAAGATAFQTLTSPYTDAQQNTDEQNLIAQRRQEQQASIDAINQGFNAQLQQESAAGAVRMQQTNAQNVAMGLVGSPDAFSASQGTSSKNQQNVANIQAQQASTVAGILMNIDNKAIDDVAQRHQQTMSDAGVALQTTDNQVAATKQDQKDAVDNSFTPLAKSTNLQWADFQKQYPDYAAKLLAQTGLDPVDAAFKWNATKSAAQQIQWQAPVKTDTGYMFYGLDPVTGLPKTQEVNLPSNGDWTVSPANQYQDTMMVNKNTGEIKTLTDYQNGIPGNIDALAPTGSTGGECGDFIHTIVDNVPTLGDTVASKDAVVNSQGVLANKWKASPKIGDVVVMNVGDHGHVAVVNKVLPNGQVQLTESNFHLDGKVDNSRVVSVDDPSIYGAFTKGQIKGSVADGSMSERQMAIELKHQQALATLDRTKQSIETAKTMEASRRNTIVTSVVKDLYGSLTNSPVAKYNNSATIINRINPSLMDALDSGTAAKNVPDLDLIDAYVQIARGGGNITEAQVDTLVKGFGLGDTLDVAKQKLSGGAVLSDSQRNELAKLSKQIYDEQGKSAQKAVDQINSRLTKQGIPSEFLFDKPEDMVGSVGDTGVTPEQKAAFTAQLQPGEIMATGPDGQTYAVTQDMIDSGDYTPIQ